MKKSTRLILSITCLSLLVSVARADTLSHSISAKQAIDLTHKMHEGMPFWPGGVPFKMQRLVDYDKGYRLHKFEVGENTGTHVDAPAHFVKGNRAIDEIPLTELILPAVVIDVKDKVAGNSDYELTPEDIKLWESRHGTIPANSLVILNTGWHKRFESPEQ
ncbi:MAG: cyclase family protein, partial [Gammaproteobacteria bacterium]|nr:cyclase family protein [Gammaproteobacteria bacterium]